MNDKVKNLEIVFSRLMKMAKDDPEYNADVIATEMDNMLDLLQSDDFFETEGQTDPRGDFRNNEYWSVCDGIEI